MTVDKWGLMKAHINGMKIWAVDCTLCSGHGVCMFTINRILEKMGELEGE